MKTYKNIKSILRNLIKTKVNVLWTWKKGTDEEFTMIYNNYGNDLTIYTSEQLLKEIENEEKTRKLGEDMERQRQERIKRLNESAQVGGVNIFEGMKEDAIVPERTGRGPLDHMKPGDSGVNIDGILNVANGKWKNLI